MPIISFIGHIPTELFGKTDNTSQIYKIHKSTFYTSYIKRCAYAKKVKNKELRILSDYVCTTGDLYIHVTWLDESCQNIMQEPFVNILLDC